MWFGLGFRDMEMEHQVVVICTICFKDREPINDF